MELIISFIVGFLCINFQWQLAIVHGYTLTNGTDSGKNVYINMLSKKN